VREVKWSVLTQSCCRHYLDTFCSHQMNKRRTEGLDWDHAMLLTGHDLYTSFDRDRASSGMAFLSGMCSKSYSCTISEARSLGTSSLIIAHELAHNLGVDHDGVNSNRDCDSENFIMGPKLSPGATAWSPCSRRQLSRFLSKFGKCLENVPAVSQWRHQHDLLPGQRFDGDHQCQLMYGSRWRLYSQGVVNGQQVNICQAIWCRSYINLKSPNAAALQGTTCSRGRHCLSGECVPAVTKQETSPPTTTPSPSTTSTTTKSLENSLSPAFHIIYKMKVCDFFKLLSPNNFPSSVISECLL